MRLLNFIFILLIGQSFMDCSSKKDSNPPEIKTQNGTLIEDVDDVPPPPPGLTSNFKTLHEWLFNLCDKEKPEKSIMTYDFGLFESPGDYTIFLVGLNSHENGKYSTTRIDFEPSNMYFRLPVIEYENLNRQQVLDKLTSQLKDFTKTEKFKTSFFAKATLITTDFKGKIWPN